MPSDLNVALISDRDTEHRVGKQALTVAMEIMALRSASHRVSKGTVVAVIADSSVRRKTLTVCTSRLRLWLDLDRSLASSSGRLWLEAELGFKTTLIHRELGTREALVRTCLIDYMLRATTLCLLPGSRPFLRCLRCELDSFSCSRPGLPLLDLRGSSPPPPTVLLP